MSSGKVLNPSELPTSTRRIIGNELIQALRAKRWVKHTRDLGSNSGNFRILGAHTSTSRREERIELVERYLSLVLLPDARIGMPMLAILLSGTAYDAAENDAGSSWLSLRHLLKNRATSPYKIDTDKGRYRVRKMPRSGATAGALEALDVLVQHCLVVNLSSGLADAFADALADAPGAGVDPHAVAVLEQQLGLVR